MIPSLCWKKFVEVVPECASAGCRRGECTRHIPLWSGRFAWKSGGTSAPRSQGYHPRPGARERGKASASSVAHTISHDDKTAFACRLLSQPSAAVGHTPQIRTGATPDCEPFAFRSITVDITPPVLTPPVLSALLEFATTLKPQSVKTDLVRAASWTMMHEGLRRPQSKEYHHNDYYC